MTHIRSEHGLRARGLALATGLACILPLAACVLPKPPPAAPTAKPATVAAPAPEPVVSCERIATLIHPGQHHLFAHLSNDRQLDAFVRCQPQATNIRLEGSLTDYSALGRLHALDRLNLRTRQLAPLKTLPQLPQLRILTLSVPYPYRPEASLLDRLGNLEDMSINSGASRARFSLSPHDIRVSGSSWQPWFDAVVARRPTIRELTLWGPLDLSQLDQLPELTGMLTDGTSLASAPALPKLQRLRIMSGKSVPVQSLARFGALRQLNSGVPLSGSSQPLALNALESLEAPLEDARIVSAFVNAPLKHIGLHRLEDLRPLLQLPQLQSVKVNGQVSTTAPLKQLQDLHSLVLGIAPDLAVLESAPALRQLSLRFVPPPHASLPVWPRWSAPALRDLTVYGRKLPTRWLLGARRLTRLKIEVDRGADLRPLAALRHLTELEIDAPPELQAQERPDLTALRALRKLKRVRLSGCFRNAAVLARTGTQIRLPPDAIDRDKLAALRDKEMGGFQLSGRPCVKLKLAR